MTAGSSRRQRGLSLASSWSLVLAAAVVPAATRGAVYQADLGAGQLSIRRGDRPVAVYVWDGEAVSRPYWKDLHAPGGIQVSRAFPPVDGRDATDHATMHPGLWLAFGDISGCDYWRNRNAVRHVRFVELPRPQAGGLGFAVENALLGPEGGVLCRQTDRFLFTDAEGGILLTWEARFEPVTGPIVFGDQEEMGLGIRLATGLTERDGGVIRSSEGREGAARTWGRIADWCDAAGTLGGHPVGVTVMADPARFRPSGWHNRDYGLLVANAFGRGALRLGEPSAVAVEPGQWLDLRFGVFLHDGASVEDLGTVYRAFVAGR